MRVNQYKYVYLLLLQIFILQILSFFPKVVEQVYSTLFFQLFSKLSRILLGWIPFSVGDLIYLTLIIYFIFYIFKQKDKDFSFFFCQVTKCICWGYFLFHIFWGLNYYRVPISEKMNLKSEYNAQQLYNFTLIMIENTNKVHIEITNNKNLKVINLLSQNQIFLESQQAYKILKNKHSQFEYNFPSQKKSLISFLLSYMGFGGYINPFTNESQVNYQIPMYNFPSTACHEMSHQIGYASESEANFIGFLACISSKNKYFKYSGYTYALKYCLRNWEERNPLLYAKLLAKINPGVLLNHHESTQFWESKHTFIDVFFQRFYDNFLKMNQQNEGLKSYSKFVDLLINYYKI